MAICKLCHASDDANHHINKEGFCGPCYTLLNYMRYDIGSTSEEQRRRFFAYLEYNAQHNGYIPLQFRSKYPKRKKAWSCAKCGRLDNKDTVYTSMCYPCADLVRRSARRTYSHSKEYVDRQRKLADAAAQGGVYSASLAQHLTRRKKST